MRSHLHLPLPVLLALRAHLGRHRTPSLVAFLAVAASVTLATALEMSTRSMQEELVETAANLAGAAAVQIVGGTVGVSNDLVAVVSGVAGVQVAVPLVVAAVRVNREEGRSETIHVLGVDIRQDAGVRFYRGGGRAGESLALAGQPSAMLLSEALARRLRIQAGDTLSMRLGGRAREVTIRGILSPRGVAEAYAGEVGVMEVGRLQTLLEREGWLDRIDVVLSPGSSKARVIEAIRAKIGDRGTVCGTAGPNAWAETALLMLQIIVSALIAITCLVASLVSYSALSWFVDRLTPELGLLKAAGLEPRRLRRLLYVDAGLLAFLGTGVGMASGCLLSERFLASLSWLSTFIDGVELQHLTFRTSTFAVGVIVGGSVSVAGVLGPARRASQLLPLDAALGIDNWTEQRAGRRRSRALTTGLIVVGLLAAPLGSVPPMARVVAILFISFAVLGIVVDIVLPVAVRYSRAVLDTIIPGVGRLIGTGLLVRPDRTALTITCVAAVAAGITVSLTLMRSTAGTLDNWLESQFSGGVFVTTDNVFSTRPAEAILPQTVAEIRRTPRVKAVFEEVSEKIFYQGEEVLLVAGSMSTMAQYGKLQVVGGSSRDVAEALVNGQVAISERFAHHFGTRQGDFLTLNTPKGFHTFRVAGVIRDYAGPAGSLNIDISVFDELWFRQGSRDIVFWTEGDPALVIPGIRSRLAGQQSLLFSYGESLTHFVSHQMARLRGILASVALMSALLGGVAISSLMLSSVPLYARDRALLAAAGATRGQIRAIKLLEGLLLGLCGGAAGIALGLLASYPIILSILPSGIGWALTFVANPGDLFLLISCLAGSSLIASAYPAWIVGQVCMRSLSSD